jgi:hypothetical protein
MIGFHIQNSPPDWLHAVDGLRVGTPVKLVFGVERCREAKITNPDVKTWYRWVGAQPLPESDFEEHARQWLAQFIDGTFRREAQYVDFIQEYNETLANSQSSEERARWIQLHTAMAEVWQNEYRKEPELAHIRMILCETAVGNDIPLGIAAAAVRYDALLGYHPYIVCRVAAVSQGALAEPPTGVQVRHDAPRATFRGDELYKMQVTYTPAHLLPRQYHPGVSAPDYVSPHDWTWYSGRWATMDAQFAAQGIRPDWVFGEMGPVLDASSDWSGWLDPHGGWKHRDCLNGDIDKYLAVLEYWLDNLMLTPAYGELRVLGGTLFTSGAPGSGPDWDAFNVVQPEMDTIAEFGRSYDYVEQPVNEWQQELWNKSIELQTVQLNPNAALQAAIFADGFVPVQSEFWHVVDGTEYAAQAAEHLGSSQRRVYYAIVPNWSDVRWFTS